MEQSVLEMIDSLHLEERIAYDSIPNLDLYMDQVITLFENRLSHTKRYESDKLLTKTMINNYIKDKLLMPAVKKKYTKEHIVLMILLYEMKQVLTIGDIKDLFSMVIRDGKADTETLREVYEMYLGTTHHSTSCFEKEAETIHEEVANKMEILNQLEEEEVEKLSSMLEVILLTQKAVYYKRLAEKIIDEKIKSQG